MAKSQTIKPKVTKEPRAKLDDDGKPVPNYKVYMEAHLLTALGDWRGLLRISTSPWGRKTLMHIREWYPSNEPGRFLPGRGIGVELKYIDAMLYGLALLREDILSGELVVGESQNVKPIFPYRDGVDMFAMLPMPAGIDLSRFTKLVSEDEMRERPGANHDKNERYNPTHFSDKPEPA